MDPSESFPCPYCGVELVVNARAAANTGPCPECGGVLTVPDEPHRPGPVSTAAGPVPRRPWLRNIAILAVAGGLVAAGVRWFPGEPQGVPSSPEPRHAGPVVPDPDPATLAQRRPGAATRPSPAPAEAAIAAGAPVPQLAQTASAPPPRAEPIPDAPAPKAVPIDPPAPKKEAPRESRPEPARPAGAVGQARTALEKFLAAKDVKDRGRFVRNPAKTRPEMAAYYRTNPDASGPEAVESIRFVHDHPVPDSDFRFYVFEVVRTADGLPAPVCVEQTKQGYLVDWQAYIEARDRKLEKYCESWKDEPGTFRVLLERVHYFEDDVPDQDTKVAFKAVGPAAGKPYIVWVHKVTPVFAQHFQNTERMNWDTTTFPIAKLRWVRDGSGTAWIQVQDIISDSWRTE